MLMMPEVNSASTVSTSPEKWAATWPGFCPASVPAGSRVSFRDISERSAWVIFWPNSTSRLSCAEENTPSSARLPKYSSTARNVSGRPAVNRSITRPSSSGGITGQRHAGIEDLGGELPHALHAVVHIGDSLGHQLARALLLQRDAALPHQIGVQDALHPAVDVVGKAADIEPLDEPRRLHQQRHRDIDQHQHRHLGGGLVAAQNVGKALGQPPLKPRRGQQAHVIDHGGRHKSQRKPLHAEIGADPVGAERLTLPHRPLRLPPFFESAESPRDSPLWTRCTACPAPP